MKSERIPRRGWSVPAAARAVSRTLRDALGQRGPSAARTIELADGLERQGRLLDALDACVSANRLRRDGALECRIMQLRLRAFEEVGQLPQPPPAFVRGRPTTAGPPPEVDAADVTVEMVREGVLGHGSILVRGLVPRTRVARLRDNMDRAFEAFDAADAGAAFPDLAAWYTPRDDIRTSPALRKWRRDAGAVLASESPRAFFDLVETVHDVGLSKLIGGYFGERPMLAAEKVTMFRVHADDYRVREASWHQDGAFLGGAGIRTLNVWFALSRCGRDAPGMAVMPVAIDRILPVGEDGAPYDWALSSDTVAREMAGMTPWRPQFEEGDVLVFDHLTVHRTAADEGMPNWRYAFETWFFAPSFYPRQFSTPLVV